MKKVFFAIVLLFVLATLNSCDNYENKADIENQENQNINHDEVGDEDTDQQEGDGS